MTEPKPGPLHGVRVLDLTRVVAGPYCSMFLGDLGAEVVKVEQPGAGDDTRGWGPPFTGGESAYFLSINRNKQSLTLDLKSKRAAEILRALAKQADVIIENFRPGTMERLGLGEKDLRRINPRLIYGSLTGFGADGPMSDWPGYDLIVQAWGGLMSITGTPDGEPVKVGVAIIDLVAGLMLGKAIVAALYVREKTGIGLKQALVPLHGPPERPDCRRRRAWRVSLRSPRSWCLGVGPCDHWPAYSASRCAC